jgi:hypothetical protein
VKFRRAPNSMAHLWSCCVIVRTAGVAAINANDVKDAWQREL